MTADAFFAMVPIVLRWTAILAVLAVTVLTVVRNKSRIGLVTALVWTLWGLIVVVVLPLRWNSDVQVFGYVLYTWIAVQNARKLMGWGPTREQAYESNRRLANAVLGRRLADRIVVAPIDRMRVREQQAKERGVTVLDIMKEEHASRH